MEIACKQSQDYKSKIIKELEALPDKNLRFTEFEDEMLRKYYPTKGGAAMAKVLGKTHPQIKSRVQCLGVKRL